MLRPIQDVSRIAKAADVGRQAYRVGGSLSAEERVRRGFMGRVSTASNAGMNLRDVIVAGAHVRTARTG